MNIENYHNVYQNKEHNVDYQVTAKSKLSDLLTFNNSKVQAGLFYRNTNLNYLLNLNLSHANMELNDKTKENQIVKKMKLGFIKQHSLKNDFEIVLGSRLNFLFKGFAKEFQFNNIKTSAGLIHKDASAFIHFTKPKSASLEKASANLLIKLLPGLNIFGQVKYENQDSKSDSDKEEPLSYSLGHQIEVGKNSLLKMKFTNKKNIHFNLSKKIDENLKIKIIGKLGYIGSSQPTFGKIESRFGCSISYTD